MAGMKEPSRIPRMIADREWPSGRPFVVLMSQEPVAKSSGCDFGPEIDRFPAFAVDRYEVDRQRVYLTGLRCGAIGAWDLLAETRQTSVAAAIPIPGHPVWAMKKLAVRLLACRSGFSTGLAMRSCLCSTWRARSTNWRRVPIRRPATWN
jgi:hypothetical protein